MRAATRQREQSGCPSQASEKSASLIHVGNGKLMAGKTKGPTANRASLKSWRNPIMCWRCAKAQDQNGSSYTAPRPYATGSPTIEQDTDPETTRIATEPGRFAAGTGAEIFASPDSNIKVTPQDTLRIRDSKSIASESNACNVTSHSSTTDTKAPERTSRRTLSGVRSTSQFVRMVPDASSDEIMAYLVAGDFGQQTVRSFQSHGSLTAFRSGWLQRLVSNSWILQT